VSLASDGWHLGALVLVITSGLPAAHGCGAVKQEPRLVVVLIVSLRSRTRRLTCAARPEVFLD
jgi:hypothetical protein